MRLPPLGPLHAPAPTASSLDLEWGGERIVLYARRALYWPRRRTLVVADTHFGKDATFRSAGVALPTGTTASDLGRLTALLAAASAERLLILGDFFHASRGRQEETMTAIAEWRSERPGLTIVNVRGNHDLRAGDPPVQWGIDVVDEPFVEVPFVWQHHPSNHPAGFAVGGHFHPGVALDGGAGGRLKAACFWFRERSAVLPAFSEFTGMAMVQPRAADRIFVVRGDEIVGARVGS